MAKRYSTEDKLAVVMAVIQDGTSIREICHRKDISVNMIYLWRKRFLEGGRLALETKGRSESRHVRHLQLENDELKRMLAEERLANRLLKGGLGTLRRT
ncbi:MAG: transposase [Candidatus Helarchaeota archaeon]|nr:transposase [Candidatus Helarchaeota archaeon]